MRSIFRSRPARTRINQNSALSGFHRNSFPLFLILASISRVVRTQELVLRKLSLALSCWAKLSFYRRGISGARGLAIVWALSSLSPFLSLSIDVKAEDWESQYDSAYADSDSSEYEDFSYSYDTSRLDVVDDLDEDGISDSDEIFGVEIVVERRLGPEDPEYFYLGDYDEFGNWTPPEMDPSMVVSETVLVVTDPTNSDTDFDGWDDLYEWENGYHPVDSSDGLGDPDEDGLVSSLETLHGYDPENWDSNEDGISDYDDFYHTIEDGEAETGSGEGVQSTGVTAASPAIQYPALDPIGEDSSVSLHSEYLPTSSLEFFEAHAASAVDSRSLPVYPLNPGESDLLSDVAGLPMAEELERIGVVAALLEKDPTYVVPTSIGARDSWSMPTRRSNPYRDYARLQPILEKFGPRTKEASTSEEGGTGESVVEDPMAPQPSTSGARTGCNCQCQCCAGIGSVTPLPEPPEEKSKEAGSDSSRELTDEEVETVKAILEVEAEIPGVFSAGFIEEIYSESNPPNWTEIALHLRLIYGFGSAQANEIAWKLTDLSNGWSHNHLDGDGDYVPDYLERILMLDLDGSDSDGDGLDCVRELTLTLTHPQDPDTDGDDALDGFALDEMPRFAEREEEPPSSPKEDGEEDPAEESSADPAGCNCDCSCGNDTPDNEPFGHDYYAQEYGYGSSSYGVQGYYDPSTGEWVEEEATDWGYDFDWEEGWEDDSGECQCSCSCCYQGGEDGYDSGEGGEYEDDWTSEEEWEGMEEDSSSEGTDGAEPTGPVEGGNSEDEESEEGSADESDPWEQWKNRSVTWEELESLDLMLADISKAGDAIWDVLKDRFENLEIPEGWGDSDYADHLLELGKRFHKGEAIEATPEEADWIALYSEYRLLRDQHSALAEARTLVHHKLEQRPIDDPAFAQALSDNLALWTEVVDPFLRGVSNSLDPTGLGEVALADEILENPFYKGAMAITTTAQVVTGAGALKEGGKLLIKKGRKELGSLAEEGLDDLVRASDESRSGFEVSDGVRRAKAAQLNGDTTIRAIMNVEESGEIVAKKIDVPIDQLNSPMKSQIDATTAKEKARWERVLKGTEDPNVELPPITINPGNRGLLIKDVEVIE